VTERVTVSFDGTRSHLAPPTEEEGAAIIAAIDAWEHAYFLDYGTKKPDYLAGVLKHLNWSVLNGRLPNFGQSKA